MPSINITQLDFSEREICRYFESLHPPEELQIIFGVAMNDERLFPNMNLPNNATYQDYIDRWIHSYIQANNNPARNRIASRKGSCNSPAIRTIVKMAQTWNSYKSGRENTHLLLGETQQNN